MSNNENIGKWVAQVKKEGKTPQIVVDGTFPTKGQKPRYHLVKNEPQGPNPTELLLTLVFGSLATPGGPVSFSVHYTEAIGAIDTFKTVLVIDDKGRTIANVVVEAAAKKKPKKESEGRKGEPPVDAHGGGLA